MGVDGSFSSADATPEFRRRFRGYDPGQVNRFLTAMLTHLQDVRAELEAVRAADPLEHVGEDIASMLRSLAEAVQAVHERAEREAQEAVRAASEEAARIRAEAEAFAETVIDEVLTRAEAQFATANDQRARLQEALTAAAEALTTALRAVHDVNELHIDLRPQAPGDEDPRSDATDTNGNAPHAAGEAPPPQPERQSERPSVEETSLGC